jgi:hypothetical protein
MKVDVLGTPLKEGINILTANGYQVINIKKTQGINAKFERDLEEPRIIRVIIDNDKVYLVVGYF